jgi:sialate O-acetylesterase
VPVGIIDVSMGSLLIEAYLSRRVIEENADVKAALTPGFYKAESAVTNDYYLQITSFYNAKIAPLSGFALRGFLYYQGESNNAYPDKFGVLLDALIEDWSATFGSPLMVPATLSVAG